MAYTVKYRCEFSNREANGLLAGYRFEISQKDYTGPFFTVQAAGTPIIHKWGTDDPKAPIKGSSIVFSYLNKGNQPIEIFYSDSDDSFLGTLYNLTTGETLFSGYLVQEDCSEILTDATHPCSLSFNDNLGLLKNVPLDKGFEDAGLNINQKCTLLDLLFACLGATNLQLTTRIFCEIYQLGQTQVNSMFAGTKIDPASFLNNDDIYENCYNVLEKILKARFISLFQSNGAWHIVRWDDMRYYANAMRGWQWDANRNEQGLVIFGNTYTAGTANESVPVFGSTKKPNRPFKFVKETFNYRQPVELIKNKDLKRLGPFISTFSGGGIRFDKYQFPVSSGWQHFNNDISWIVVETDIATKKEIQRYVEQLFVDSGATPQRTCWQFNDIEVNANDRIRLSMQFKADADHTSDRFAVIINLIKKPNGAVIGPSPDFKWATLTPGTFGGDPFLRWNKNTVDYNASFVPGNFMQYDNVQNADQWHTFDLSNYMSTQYGVDIPVPVVPADGLLKIYVVGWNEQSNDSKIGWIKDIQFGLDFLINESISVIGQVHTQTNAPNIKNDLTEEIFSDDSPRNSISGTLFTPNTPVLLAERTALWTRQAIASSDTLGHIAGFDQLFWRKMARTEIEGSLAGIIQAGNTTLSMASIMRFAALNALNFVFGSLEINYRDDSAAMTAYEMYRDGELPADLTDNYLFSYLYENK